MATYYRWRKSILEESKSESENFREPNSSTSKWLYRNDEKPSIVNSEYYAMDGRGMTKTPGRTTTATSLYWSLTRNTDTLYHNVKYIYMSSSGRLTFESDSPDSPVEKYELIPNFQEYVYSTYPSAYPNGGVQGGYYYDQRIEVTSPSTPGSISYSVSTVSTSIQVSWNAATSNVPGYSVDHYELQRQINEGGWTTVNSNIRVTSFTASLTSDTTTYRFRVRAVDTNGQSGDWKTGNTGTKINAPGAPSVSAPSEAVSGESITVNWGTVSGATSYTVQRNTGGSWTQVYSGDALTFSETVGVWDSLQYRVQGVNAAGGGSWGYSAVITVYTSPTLTVPQMVMQGQQATIIWSPLEGADSYTLQRKSSADADWTQVYSGSDTTFTETVGTWTSLQYRVQAVFDETPGGWATSDPVQIVGASALVISGQDGDLGTVVNDVLYSISSDQTSPTIDVTVEVNGGEYDAFTATSGQTYKVNVLDLPTGTGSIVITASYTVSEYPVTVTRTWTYSKTAQTFSNAGGVAQLTLEGATIWPKTLDEVVRTSMNPWGGNLSTALNLLKNAALFNRTKQPKYSEVTISLSGKTEGQTIQLPEGGKMVEFYVSKLNYEEGLNGTGRVLVVRKDCYDNRMWDSGNVNAYATSDTDAWMNGEYKALFPEEIQTAMGTTKFYYTPGNGNDTVGTLERAVFTLSATELGLSQTWFNVEGSALPIVNTLKIAYLNGNANTQWTRTPNTSAVTHAIFLNTSGSVGNGACNYSAGARPCFTLPSTFSGTYYVDHNGGIHDQQEYTEAGDWLDVWGNVIPAVKMETGSYVGTGTYGQSNPTTLTFPFEPKVVFVTKKDSFLVSSAFVGFVWLFGQDTITSSGPTTFTVNDNGLSWYSNGASNQLNVSGVNYVYVALG